MKYFVKSVDGETMALSSFEEAVYAGEENFKKFKVYMDDELVYIS